MVNSKEKMKASAEKVGEVLVAVAESKKPIHKESIPQKIYVGPNLPGLPKYTIVEKEITKHIESFIKKCAEVEKVIVPIEKMVETEARIKEKGTLEHRHYNKIVEFHASERKGDA